MRNAIILILLFVLVPTVAAQEIWVTKGGYIGAVKEADYDRAAQFVTQKDKAAFERFVKSKEDVFIVPEGIPVYREEVIRKNRKVKVRPKGKTESFYTSINGIERKD